MNNTVFAIACLGGPTGESGLGDGTLGGVVMPPTYADTTGSSANLNIDSAGQLRRFSSSLKYKKNVEDYDKGLDELLTLRPVSYQSKQKCDKDRVFAGFISEELDALGLDEYVERGAEGQPEGINYSNMMALAVKAIQELTARLEALENK